MNPSHPVAQVSEPAVSPASLSAALPNQEHAANSHGSRVGKAAIQQTGKSALPRAQTWKSALQIHAAAYLGIAFGSEAHANPNTPAVSCGTATFSQQGNQLNITASHNAFINWSSFNIGPGEATRFIQPSAASVVWNRIHDANPSQIHGRLEANGTVVLMNQAGFYFGPNAVVNAAGLVVSTAPVIPAESGAGLFWQFSGAPPSASIVNYGQISVGNGGAAFLIAEQIQNHGTISAPGGSLGLLAGQEVLLSERPDGRGMSAAVTLPAGSVDNRGRLLADAGTIALNARVVNQAGLVQANSVRERHGVIELFASEAATLEASSELSARGGNDGVSPGGAIIVKSEGVYADAVGSTLRVAGGAQGGDGGFVEVSAPVMDSIRSQLDGQATEGYRGGRLLIDPLDIVIGHSGSGSATGSNVSAGDPPAAGTLELDVNTAFTGFSQITLQASRNLTVAGGTFWDLAASTGVSEPGGLLKLEAGNDVTIAGGASIFAGEHWSVTLEAGRDFAAGEGVLRSGVGSITLAETGALDALNGDLHLRAGNHVSVAAGHVRTTGGGSITVEALAGNINTGTKANGFQFQPSGYAVHPNLGGISTGGGGNVTLAAGQDVVSLLPSAGGTQPNAGSGAFGARPGDVTITAGRDVSGHFVVRNGVGSITAGRDAGTVSRLLALSLVGGGWAVTAGRDILLQEVRNPNGLFNNLGSSTSPNRHRFDYAPEAFTFLTACNSVQLRGTGLPRYNDAFSQGMPPLYPGRLTARAGAGGVLLGNDVVLFPSPLGGLDIATTDGGSLVGTKSSGLTQLIVSDSGRTQYRAFGDFGIADHAATPVHLDNDEPVRLAIAGDLRGVLLGSPKRAEITVGGNMINSRFDGQHLRAADVSLIHVGGDILNRNEFTTIRSAVAPNFPMFDPALDLVYPPLTGGAAGVENRFYYNPATQELTFQGRMTGAQLQALLNLTVRAFDAGGIPIFLPDGEPATRRAEFLPAATLQQLFAASQDVPLNPDTGYRLGGGGTFDLRANHLDLGATVGIVSQGPRGNAALAQRFTRGADINVTLAGDLDMFSSKISSLNGGDITVLAEGDVRVGSRDFTVSDAAARGIFTVDPSSVTVIARGDINVNGSRIAAYDGGDILVRSLDGNVDAGSGGTGAATVEKIDVDPETRAIRAYAPTIPGSGILATSFPRSQDPNFPASVNHVGNILVETPRGDIIASAGGVVQIPLNGVGGSAGTVTLRAGTRDAEGIVVHQGSINASGSGVIGGTVRLEATGDIQGLVFARENIDLNAQQNVNVTALAQGDVSVGAGGSVSGTIIGVGSVSASGASVEAALLSQNVAASGEVASSQVGFSQGTAAAAASQSLAGEEQQAIAAATRGAAEEEEPEKQRRLASAPKLTRTVGRVTVFLP
ncbi:MAG: filamentous hemagglutinin N-terminal domain-containing protein [Verrucomicrobiales bacterium]|nr:filamentous hemagglutinin N-terminal domain-containing protein [Verrucomicrobiales bacterium]